MKRSFLFICLSFICFSLTACYSVFTGGTSGCVVNSESNTTPKEGIANVDIYAYMNQGDRDYDYNNWQEGTKFIPTADYYGHTTSAADGSFSISKLIWKEQKPDFGKDADFTKVYLIFYHANYGIEKDESIITSDSTTNSIYKELTSVRKQTILTLNFIDVATENLSNQTVYVEISVPQTTLKNKTAKPNKYTASIIESGSITVTYPRWQSDEDKSAEKETEPQITIKYYQSAEENEVQWKGCYHLDNDEQNYAFRSDALTGITKTIKNSVYSLTFYGKTTRPVLSGVSGQYIKYGNSSDDGILLSMKAVKNSDGTFLIDCGNTSTFSQIKGATSEEKHGLFSNLGQGYFWKDDSYTERFAETTVFISDENESSPLTYEMTVKNDNGLYNIVIQ